MQMKIYQPLKSSFLRRGKRLIIGASLLFLSGLGLCQAADSELIENWDTTAAPYFFLFGPGQSRAVSGIEDTAAEDCKVLQLELASNPTPGPGNGPEIQTQTTFKFTTYSSRLKTANCSAQPNAGVVTGFFTYYNDGKDYNLDGLPDNSEIDFEWLCAEPETIYLTMWTDYRDSDEAHKRVARKINLKTGVIEYTCYFEAYGEEACQPLKGAANQPEAIAPLTGYDSSTAYYEYGLTWTSIRVTWWLKNPGSEDTITLWDYQGPATHIPSRPAYHMINVFHTNNWTPYDHPGAIEAPNAPISAFVDWTKIAVTAFPNTTKIYFPLVK